MDQLKGCSQYWTTFTVLLYFRRETENCNKLSSFDIQLIHNKDSIETCVFKKPNYKDIFTGILSLDMFSGIYLQQFNGNILH